MLCQITGDGKGPFDLVGIGFPVALDDDLVLFDLCQPALVLNEGDQPLGRGEFVVVELDRAALTSVEGQDRTTNSGLFRHYVLAYLQTHPKIHNDDFTMLVRQLQPTDEGLPIELYCFVKDTAWAAYEEVQATIFDQLLATLPAFGLRVLQGESDFAEPDAVPRRLEVSLETFKAESAGS